MLATFVRGGAGSTRDYVELPPDFALRLVPVPAELAGQTLAQARLPQRTGARVIEIKRRSPRGGDERVIPVADTVLEATDQLIVLGPTTALEALEQGRLPVRDEAEAIRVLD
jgi:Trk K+ transport system NAD-binding subunit